MFRVKEKKFSILDPVTSSSGYQRIYFFKLSWILANDDAEYESLWGSRVLVSEDGVDLLAEDELRVFVEIEDHLQLNNIQLLVLDTILAGRRRLCSLFGFKMTLYMLFLMSNDLSVENEVNGNVS